MATRRHEVVVRFVRTQAFCDHAVAARAERILSPEEREVLARLRSSGARRDHLAAHALARTMLAELSGGDPVDVRFRIAPLGRPVRIVRCGAPDLHLSLTHADGVALCAVTEGCEVGADVGSRRSLGPDPLALAGVICSERERKALYEFAPDVQAEHLLSVWTLKEAVAKVTGLGLRLSLQQMTVDEDGEGNLQVSFEGSGQEPRRFHGRIACLRLTPNHVGAVALLASPWAGMGLTVEEYAVASLGRGPGAAASRIDLVRRPSRVA